MRKYLALALLLVTLPISSLHAAGEEVKSKGPKTAFYHLVSEKYVVNVEDGTGCALCSSSCRR